MQFDIVAGDSVQDKEGRIWIWDRIHNCIGYFCGNNYNFRIAKKYSEKSFGGLDLFLKDNKIYIVSQFDAEILIYDMKKNNFMLVQSERQQKASQYYSVELDNNRILLLSYELKYNSVLFDMQTGKFEDIFLLKTDKYLNKVISRYTVTEKKIIVSISDSNRLLLLDRTDATCEDLCIQGIDNIGGICADTEDDIWLMEKNGDRLIHHTKENDNVIKIGNKQECDLFSRLVKWGNKIITIPRYATYIYVYDIFNEKVNRVKVPMHIDVPEDTSSLFWNCFARKGKLIFLPWRYPQILELDIDNLKAESFKAYVTGIDFWRNFLPDLICENKEMDLELLFDAAGKRDKTDKIHDDIGAKIWRTLISNE